MKNIKILETTAVFLISFLLFSFAVVQEKSAQAKPNPHLAVHQIVLAKQSTTTVASYRADTRSSLSTVSYSPFFKVISFIVVFVVIVSLFIIVIGFYFYNVYSIRP